MPLFLRRAVVVLPFLVLLPLFAAEVSPQLPADRAAGYQLAWHDEFEGDKLNAAEWTIRTGERFASRNL